MPELEALSSSSPDLAVDGQQAVRVVKLVHKLHVTYPMIAGNDELARPFKPRCYLTTILYSPSGEQVWVKEGRTTRSEVEQALQQAR